MYLLNGTSKNDITYTDRGFQYGDGLFETIEVSKGSPVFFNQHMQRLIIGCQRLLLPTPDIEILKREAFQLAASTITKNAVLKLMITRGSGGRGYRQPDRLQPTRLLTLHSFPDYPETFKQQGITVKFCHTRLGLNPVLAGIKHMNRLEQIMARAEWNDSEDIQEGLMLDLNNNIIEGTMSNVFMVKDAVLYTPRIINCGVEGVLKNILIALAKQQHISVIEKNISKAQLYEADEVFVTNSIMGIWPIKQIEKQSFNIGSLTYKLQSLLSAFKEKQINQ